MYVVLYDQAGSLSFDKRISTEISKYNNNDIYSKFDYEKLI